MQKLTLIKLGGSVITDKSKPYTARIDVIQRLGKEIKQALRIYNGKIIIGHGGGSFPHTSASKYKTQNGLVGKNSIKGFCLTADEAIQINRIVVKELLGLGLSVASFAPLSFIYGDKIQLGHLQKALQIGVIPIVYGDVVMDKEHGFGVYSGEAVLDLLAGKLSKSYKIDKIIMAGDTDGVYDNLGKNIPIINSKNYKKVSIYITGSKNKDVTGGMLHKVKESLQIARKYDAEVYVLNGFDGNKLKKAILGQKITATIIKE